MTGMTGMIAMNKKRKRYGGLSDTEVYSQDLSAATDHQLLMAIHGCVQGAKLAFRDDARSDHTIMLDRIETLSRELHSRMPQPTNAPRRPSP